MSTKKTVLISLSVLVLGIVVTTLIFFTEPTAERGGATKKSAMLVDVEVVHRDTFQPTIIATGTVQPSKDINLSPRVSGEILSITDGFKPGGFIPKGEVILQIDPSDYRIAVQQQRSALLQAEADLKMEYGRQDAAKQGYQLIGDTLSAENEALVLRQPQLIGAKANLEASKAALKQAELNLDRTTIKAPFDAHIISRNANVGSQVSPGDILGRMVGRDAYWIIVTIPVSKLNWLSFEEDTNRGAEVIIRNRTAWPEGVYRKGILLRLIGALENQTRMARVLVSVPDPLTKEKSEADAPPLMIGSFVETRIQAREIPDVIRLKRDYLRKDGAAWVMHEGQLQIRSLDIVFEDATYAYVADGLEEGDHVVTTNLATVVEGSNLRVVGNDSSTAKTSQK